MGPSEIATCRKDQPPTPGITEVQGEVAALQVAPVTGVRGVIKVISELPFSLGVDIFS